MKKLITAIVLFCAMCCGSLFAEDNGSIYKSGDNVFIFEATGAALGFGFNQVVTYDHMMSDTFGIGGGIALAEGIVATIDGFVDFKFTKWNLGVGMGYNYRYSSTSWILRGVYHGNSWDWGSMKAGWTIGADWHLYSAGGENIGDAMGALLGMIPRFVLGVNCQLK